MSNTAARITAKINHVLSIGGWVRYLFTCLFLLGALLCLGILSDHMMDAVLSGLYKLILAALGVLLLRALLWWFDMNTSFIATVNGWENEKARALYFGCRLIAGGIILGLILG